MLDRLLQNLAFLRRKFVYFYYKLKLHLCSLFSYLGDHFGFYLLSNRFFNEKRAQNLTVEYITKSHHDIFDFDSLLLKESSENEVDYSSIYPCSNDIVDVKEDLEKPQLFVGIANVTSLDIVASNIIPDILIFTDINKAQLKYLKLIIDIISISETRAEFLSTLCGKKKSDVSKIVRKIDSSEKDIISIEDGFWRCDNEQKIVVNEIHEEFLDYKTVKEEGVYKGMLHKRLGTRVFGGLRVITTFILNEKNQIKTIGEPFDVFPICRRNGFLSSEDKYKHLRNLLSDQPYLLINNPLSADLISTICSEFRYHKIMLWLSNILNPCFLSKDTYNLLDKLLFLKFCSAKYYNITIIEDQRRRFFPRVYERNPTPHWDAFGKVLRYVKGECVEIVNIKEWVKQGTTLHNTKRVYFTDFLSSEGTCDCTFIHVLIGHGMDIKTYKEIVMESFRRSGRTIILEHNKESKDFQNKNLGLTVKELIEMFGEPTHLLYSTGFKCKNRNIIAVYDSNQ